MILIDILRLIIALTGVGIFAATLSSLARRKMTESFCLTWGLMAIIMILGGLFLRPYGIADLISPAGLLMIVIIGFCVIFGAFYITGKVSELTRKNQELAIQVSLINQENQNMLEQLEELQKILKTEKADS